MRVAVHAGQLLQPVPGGIGRYVRHLLAALPGAGVAPLPFAAGPRPPGPPGDDGWVDLGWPPAPLRYELWHRLRRPPLRVPGEVVHATSLAIPPPGRRPLVVTVHDLVFDRYPRYLTRRGVAFHRRGLALARREARAVVVPSAATAADVVAAGVVPARVHVAPHGIDPPAPAEPGADARRLARLGVAAPFLLFVGTIEPRKGVADLLAAHAALRARHPELAVVLGGPPGWGPLPRLDGPGVVAPGALAGADLDALYRHAVALALPSRYEGFGLPVLEAMVRGCPVVVSDTPALVEVAGDAALVAPVGDVDALTGALERLLGDGAGRAHLARAGCQRAAAFTWAASAAAHAAAYRAALG